MKTIAVLTVAASCLFAGCSSSPYQAKPQKRTTAGEVAVLGAGTAAGYAIGKAVGGDEGALIGAGVGLVGTAVASNLVQNARERELAEAMEQARREERLKVMNEYWKGRAIEGRRPDGSASEPSEISPTRQMDYPAGNYNGVEYAPRTLPVPNPG